MLGSKHVPAEYLRAGLEDRLHLLQGIVDTDGHVDPRGNVEVSQKNARLAADIVELVRSLGIKATPTRNTATLNGQQVGWRWRVKFHPGDLVVATLPQKVARLGIPHDRRRLSADHRITAVRPVRSRPVRCITVEGGEFLCGEHMIATHNSPLVAGIGLYMIVCDDEPGAEGFVIARNSAQTRPVFRDAAVAMVKKSPVLRKHLRVMGGEPNPNQIWHSKTQSFLERMTSDNQGEGKSGFLPHVIVVDEYHEHPNSAMLDFFAAGVKNRRQPLTLIITNSGASKQTACGQEHEYAVNVANGGMQNEEYFSFVCSLDKDDDPFHDETCWIKTNPSLPVLPGYEFLRKQVAEAKGMASKRARVERLHFNIWTESESPWIERDQWNACEVDELPEEIETAPCWVGLDLGLKKDMTACVAVWQLSDGRYAARATIWTPEATMGQRALEDAAPYPQWVDAGHLTTVPGEMMSFDVVARWIRELSATHNLQGVAYDRWNIDLLIDALDEIGVQTTKHVDQPGVLMAGHPQGFRSGPGRERSSYKDRRKIALFMPRSIEALEKVILERRLLVEYNAALRWAALGTVVISDASENRRITKQKSTARIDAMVALVMAMGFAESDKKREPVERTPSDLIVTPAEFAAIRAAKSGSTPWA